MAAKQYISVLSDTKVTGQQVKMTNTSNEFTGKLISVDPNGGQASDVRDLFISEIQVDGEPATSEKVNGKKVVNIHFPEYGGGQENVIEGISVNNRRVYPNSNKIVNITIPDAGETNVIEKVKVNGMELAVNASDRSVNINLPSSGDTNVIEGIEVNGEPVQPVNKVVNIVIPKGVAPTKVFTSYEQLLEYCGSEEADAGQFLAVSGPNSESADAYVLVKANGELRPVKLKCENAPIKSISLIGGAGGEIPATIDANGHAEIKLEEIEFDELHTDVLYLGDKNILDMIPDLSGSSTIQEAQNVSIPSGFDIDELAEKYNDLVAKFNALLSIVKNARNA